MAYKSLSQPPNVHNKRRLEIQGKFDVVGQFCSFSIALVSEWRMASISPLSGQVREALRKPWMKILGVGNEGKLPFPPMAKCCWAAGSAGLPEGHQPSRGKFVQTVLGINFMCLWEFVAFVNVGGDACFSPGEPWRQHTGLKSSSYRLKREVSRMAWRLEFCQVPRHWRAWPTSGSMKRTSFWAAHQSLPRKGAWDGQEEKRESWRAEPASGSCVVRESAWGSYRNYTCTTWETSLRPVPVDQKHQQEQLSDIN